jgi:hypothetical protein
MALRQPAAFPHFCKVFYECAKTNPQALGYVCILAALYLHLRPFSRFIVSSVDRQIASIDSGAWNVSPRPRRRERVCSFVAAIAAVSLGAESFS